MPNKSSAIIDDSDSTIQCNGAQEKEKTRPRLEKWPPPFPDLGKRARTLFTKGYDFGLLKLDVMTKTPNEVVFSTSCVKNLEQDKLFGSFEAKYELSSTGIMLVEKFNTDRVLLAEISCRDKILTGLKLSLGEMMTPKTNDRKTLIKGELKRERLAMNMDFEYGDKISQLTASLVLAYKGILGGVQTKFDVTRTEMSDLSFAAGYSNADFILHTMVRNSTDYGGSIYHKITENLDAGIDVVWFTDKDETAFGIAGQYQLNQYASIRGKLNNSNELGLGYQQALREGITLTLSSLFDITNAAEGKHKIGLGLQLEA